MPKKVLVAEDFADIRMMMKILLELYGYEVIEASDGYEAVEQARKHDPDLILMDIAMPVMDGVQATAAIRRHESLAHIPILAVTAYGDHYNKKAREAGCDTVINKPLDLNMLKPLMKHYLN